MNYHHKLVNLIKTQGKSFTIESYSISRKIASKGQTVNISGIITNNGWRTASVTIDLLIANTFNHSNRIFNSRFNLSNDERHQLTLNTLQPHECSAFSFKWQIPNDVPTGVYDIQLSLHGYNYKKNAPSSELFCKTPWGKALEILNDQQKHNLINPPKIFISYTWDSKEHREWVENLTEELRGCGIDIIDTHNNTSQKAVLQQLSSARDNKNLKTLLIITPNYTLKANKKPQSNSMDNVINESFFTEHCHHISFIPIIRHEKERKRTPLPEFLKDTQPIDFRGKYWKERSMNQLLNIIHL